MVAFLRFVRGHRWKLRLCYSNGTTRTGWYYNYLAEALHELQNDFATSDEPGRVVVRP